MCSAESLLHDRAAHVMCSAESFHMALLLMCSVESLYGGAAHATCSVESSSHGQLLMWWAQLSHYHIAELLTWCAQMSYYHIWLGRSCDVLSWFIIHVPDAHVLFWVFITVLGSSCVQLSHYHIIIIIIIIIIILWWVTWHCYSCNVLSLSHGSVLLCSAKSLWLDILNNLKFFIKVKFTLHLLSAGISTHVKIIVIIYSKYIQ